MPLSVGCHSLPDRHGLLCLRGKYICEYSRQRIPLWRLLNARIIAYFATLPVALTIYQCSLANIGIPSSEEWLSQVTLALYSVSLIVSQHFGGWGRWGHTVSPAVWSEVFVDTEQIRHGFHGLHKAFSARHSTFCGYLSQCCPVGVLKKMLGVDLTEGCDLSEYWSILGFSSL